MNINKPKFTVAFNGDLALIPKLAQTKEVESIFGKLTADLVGGGRPSLMLAKMDMAHLKKCIAKAHEHGLQFYYLLNTVCQSNMEFTRDYNNKLVEFLTELDEAGIDGVVVAVPYMLSLIKKRFPRIKVSISTFAMVTNPSKAKRWEDLGADRIMLMQDVNRNFRVLPKIREAVKCEIEIFATNMCLNQCPFVQGHMPANGHASCTGSQTKGFFLDYFSSQCAYRRITRPVEFIRGRFIRPEDLQDYMDLGINVFKLSGRSKSSEWILRMVKAYSERRYDGNLADLITYPYLGSQGEDFITNPARWILKPQHIHLNLIKKIVEAANIRDIFRIDNRKLDGFLDFFKDFDCEKAICGKDCRYCDQVAAKAVTVDPRKATPWIQKFKEIFEMYADGRAFKKNGLLTTLVTSVASKLIRTKNDFHWKKTEPVKSCNQGGDSCLSPDNSTIEKREIQKR
jgi:collagenase-like PrtC family protease